MRSLSILAFAAVLPVLPLPGQDANAPLSSVAAIRALDDRSLEAGEPVRLRGTVLFAEASGFTIHDGSHGIQVNLPADLPPPTVGARGVVEGKTGTNRYGGKFFAVINASSFTQEDLGAPPDPIQSSIGDIAQFSHWDQSVVVEGIILDHSWGGDEHQILLGARDGWAVARILQSSQERFRPDLIGARIRVRGINRGKSFTPMQALLVASPEHSLILDLGREDPFSLPITPIAALAEADAKTLVFAKVHGVVLHVSPQNHLYIRDEAGAACRIAIFSPLDKPDPASGLASPVPPFPGVSEGDEIEAVGVLADTGKDVGLRFCQVRVLSPEEAGHAPISTTISEVFEGLVTNQIVSLKARLLEKRQSDLGGGRFRTTLILEEDSKLLPCHFDSEEPDPYRGFHRNDLIEVTGLVPGSPDRKALHVLIRAKGDAVSRGLAPYLFYRRLWIGGGITLALVGLLSLWVISLRRALTRTEQAENAVRELNATLEERVRDRTAELETAKTELDRALGQERELGLLKSRFVAMVSHEFRTPLGMTMSALELLRHHRARLSDEKQGDLLDDIFSATLRMSGLMEQILILGRADSGKMNLRPTPLDLPALVHQLCGEILGSTGRSNPIVEEYDGDLHPAILDESLVRLILGNLISNAVKYSPEDRTVAVSVRREGDEVHFSIRDQGIGIPLEDQHHLFEAFHRARNVGEISGTGLGLLLVKRCVEIHLGRVSFESEVGQGTTFHVTLPLDPK